MFSILQWNARSLVRNGQEFKKFIDRLDNEPEVICVQETWLRPCLDFVIPGYESVRLDRAEIRGRGVGEVDTTHGGCATFIKNGMQYRRVGSHGEMECIAVEVWDSQQQRRGGNDSGARASSKYSVTVVNFYNPCKPIVLAELDEVMDKVGGHVVWAGDFNAHNPLWGSSRVDSNGSVLEEWMDKHGLVVLNDGRPTRYDIARNTSSHLDLLIASPSLARVGGWEVLGSNMGSDHYPVLGKFGRELRREGGESVLRYNFSQARWGEFLEEAKQLVGEVDDQGSVDEWNSSLCAMIHKAASRTIPFKQEPKARKRVPWWNKKCNEAVRNRNRAYSKLKKYPMLENVVEYKRLRAVARKVIKGEKRNSWRAFCEQIGPETPVGQLWSAVHKMSGKYKSRSIPVLLKGGIEAVSNKEKADMLVDSFQEVHRSECVGEERLRRREEVLEANKWKLEENVENDSPLNVEFTRRELRDAIRSGGNTAPGRD